MSGMKYRLALAAAIWASAIWLTIFPVFAEPQLPQDEEVRRILEKSLSVVEIDKEIARTQQQQTAISIKLAESQGELDKQKKSISKHQEDAGEYFAPTIPEKETSCSLRCYHPTISPVCSPWLIISTLFFLMTSLP